MKMNATKKVIKLQGLYQLITVTASDFHVNVPLSFPALRKIVRNQSKMVQKPFSDINTDQEFKNPKQAQMKSVLHKMYRPKMSTILTSTDVGRSKAMFSRTHSNKNDAVAQYDLRSAKFTLIDSLHLKDNSPLAEAITLGVNTSRLPEIVPKSYNVPTSKFFPPIEEKVPQSIEQESILKDMLYKALTNNSLFVQGMPSRIETRQEVEANAVEQNLTASMQDTDDKPTDFFENKALIKLTVSNNKKPLNAPISCTEFNEAKADIDAQEKFAEFDVEVRMIEVHNLLILIKRHCDRRSIVST